MRRRANSSRSKSLKEDANPQAHQGLVSRRRVLRGIALSVPAATAAGTVLETLAPASAGAQTAISTSSGVTGFIAAINAPSSVILQTSQDQSTGTGISVTITSDTFLIRDHVATLDEFEIGDRVGVGGTTQADGSIVADYMAPIMLTVDTTIASRSGDSLSTPNGPLLITGDTVCDAGSLVSTPIDIAANQRIQAVVRWDPKLSTGVITKVAVVSSG